MQCEHFCAVQFQIQTIYEHRYSVLPVRASYSVIGCVSTQSALSNFHVSTNVLDPAQPTILNTGEFFRSMEWRAPSKIPLNKFISYFPVLTRGFPVARVEYSAKKKNIANFPIPRSTVLLAFSNYVKIWFTSVETGLFFISPLNFPMLRLYIIDPLRFERMNVFRAENRFSVNGCALYLPILLIFQSCSCSTHKTLPNWLSVFVCAVPWYLFLTAQKKEHNGWVMMNTHQLL